MTQQVSRKAGFCETVFVRTRGLNKTCFSLPISCGFGIKIVGLALEVLRDHFYISKHVFDKFPSDEGQGLLLDDFSKKGASTICSQAVSVLAKQIMNSHFLWEDINPSRFKSGVKLSIVGAWSDQN